MNILILSVGTRNKIVQYFKKTLNGKVLATDNSCLAPALYDADKYYIVPRIDAPDYIDIIIDICKKENVSGILSLIDPELSLLAKNKNRFDDINVTVVGSDYTICERCLDKWEMFKWLQAHDYLSAQSYINLGKFFNSVAEGTIKYPVFVKPIRGSASMSINKVNNRETIELLMRYNDSLMIQQFLPGQEIGADCYIDMISGEVVSIFTKKKLLMRAGETDKSVSFKDDKLFDLLEQFIKESGFRGVIDIDIFEIDGQYFISEVNPRFGGGYPHAYESGVDFMKLIMNNLNGNANQNFIGQYKEGICMMKYNEVKMLRCAQSFNDKEV